jgi:hypothetical protein
VFINAIGWLLRSADPIAAVVPSRAMLAPVYQAAR